MSRNRFNIPHLGARLGLVLSIATIVTILAQ